MNFWNSLDRLRALKDVIVVEERFVRDGNIASAAGVSAGIDVMPAFIQFSADEQSAGTVQFAAECYPSLQSYGDFHKNPKPPAYIRYRPEPDAGSRAYDGRRKA